MRTIKTFKAQPTVESEPVQSVIVHVSEPIPDFSTLEGQRAIFGSKARELEIALHNSLPGGVYDLLLGAMLARKSSHFIVAHGATTPARKRNLVIIVEDGAVYPDSYDDSLQDGLVKHWHECDDLRQIIEDRHPELLDSPEHDMFQVNVWTGAATEDIDTPVGTFQSSFPDVVDSWYREVTEKSPVLSIGESEAE